MLADGDTLSLTYFSAPVWGAGGRRFKSCRSPKVLLQNQIGDLDLAKVVLEVGYLLREGVRERLGFVRIFHSTL